MARGKEEPKSIAKPRLVIVEGDDDRGFLKALINSLQLDDIDIWSLEGKDSLPGQLQTISLTPGFEKLQSLAIIRDADTHPERSRQSVLVALKRSQIADKLRCAVYLFPDDKNPGMLEDLCLATVEEAPAMECIYRLVECLEQKGCNLRQPPKSRACAYLAC